MIFVLSGEDGDSDLGKCVNAQGSCEGEDFKIGPMTVLLDQLLEPRLGYSVRSIPNGYHYVSKVHLVEKMSERKNNARSVSLAGKKRGLETGYFYTNAWMLAEIAQALEESRQDKAVAVLFRDCDGTRTTQAGVWQSKWDSMQSGFNRAQFDRGVPMLPNPKSEAWLLCAATPQLSDCARFENVSGNDDSPNSAKAQLDAVLGGHQTGATLCDWLDAHPIDEARAATMLSFKAFQQSLEQALIAAGIPKQNAEYISH
jgi:hypothetical protein